MAFPVLRHFKEKEFQHPEMMNAGFLGWLDLVRDKAGVPFKITSDGRPGDPNLHGLGMAVDIHSRDWNGEQKWKVAYAVMLYADYAPGKLELELVFNEDPLKDCHWHIAVDPRPGHVHELLEKDD
jgi:hypothetical protein